MTTEQRLDRVEDDLAAVRQLLASAATYAESANRGIDQLTAAQTRTQTQIDQLSEKQDRTQVQLDQLSSRVDSFVSESQRLFTKLGSTIERIDGRTESLTAIVTRLDRNYEEQKSQFQEFQRTSNAAIERIDRILDYLLRQSGDGRG